ncbi:MAG TPA: AbrB/MazE/SpoVT family DNA-binding domain-containing protein [Acidimicrobiales bacterium]|nr:AbrB/MazE/SpoVT family DNA-binding domain-containing protein [Acidimicrobiales bacterium]
MTSAGMGRRIDELGRVVLPAEVRRTLGLAAGDELLVRVEGRSIVLTAREASCVFCDSSVATEAVLGRLVCATCVAQIRSGGPDRELVDPVARDVEGDRDV